MSVRATSAIFGFTESLTKMASAAVASNVRLQKTTNPTAINCFYCLKSVSNSPIECQKCKETYHPSCFKRAQEKKNSTCRHEQYTALADMAPANEPSDREALLQRIIQELEDKNSLLAENCELLKEKIGFLEEKLKKPGYGSNFGVNTVNSQRESRTTSVVQMNETTADNQQRPPVKKNNHNDNITTHSLDLNKQHLLKNEQVHNKKTQIISPAAVQQAVEYATTANQNNTDGKNGEWQSQHRRRYRNQNSTPKQKTLGTSEASNNFMGVQKKVWIYLYRVQRSVSSAQVQEFVTKKPGYESLSIQVTELPTDETKNKCFLVTAPFSQKEDMYSPTFWPRDVGIKRYDFRIQANYKNQKTPHF